jgi:hypothetical protein
MQYDLLLAMPSHDRLAIHGEMLRSLRTVVKAKKEKTAGNEAKSAKKVHTRLASKSAARKT